MRANEYRKYELLAYVKTIQREGCMSVNGYRMSAVRAVWYVSASCNARSACGTRVLRVRALVCVGVIHREDCMCANEYGKYGWWHVLASYSARAA